MAETVLNIYDVSYLVHAGTSSDYKQNHIMGVQCGGISHLMEKVFLHISQGHSVALAFDSRNDRKEICKSFKANRVPNPEIYLQCNVLKSWCRRMGIPSYYVDGYEADEVIHNIVVNNYGIYNRVDIYSGDSDIAADLIDDRFRLIGTSTITPTITPESYQFAIKKGAVVQYNTVLPYIMFMGKASNNMDPLPTIEGVKPIELYNNYLSFCGSSNVPESERSLEKWMRLWLLRTKRDLDPRLVEEIRNRITLIYPRTLDPSVVEVPLGCKNRLNQQEVIKFMRLFGLKFSAINIGVRDQVLNTGELTDDEKRYFLNLRSQLETGTFAVDCDIPLEGQSGIRSDLDIAPFDDPEEDLNQNNVSLVDNPFMTSLFEDGEV